MKRFDNTILIITGDHGEEFWEHGRFGHTYGFVNEQIQTGTLIHFPGHLETRYKVTSHADFFPTIFDYMELNRDSDAFMTGKSMLRYNKKKDWAMTCSGIISNGKSHNCVMIGPKLKIRFSNEDTLKAINVYDAQDNRLIAVDTAKARALLMKALDAKTPKKLSSLYREFVIGDPLGNA